MQLPPNLYNLPWYQNMMGAQAQNQGPKWSESNPFRTVDNGLQFGAGNNASAGQLYEHFHRQAALDKRAGNADANIEDYGLTPGSKFQSVADFMDQRTKGREDASGIWGNNTQAYKDRVGELMKNRGWTQQYAMGNQNHALGANADFGGDGAVSNNEWARHLGADYDNDGDVTGKEWMQYQGQSPSQGSPVRPGNIPNMGPGIFNFQPPGIQAGGGLNPGISPQQPRPTPGQWTNPQQPVQGGGLNPGMGVTQLPRPTPGQWTNPQQPQGSPGQWISPQQGPTQAPMTNPQVPAFNPSMFNMQQPGMFGRR